MVYKCFLHLYNYQDVANTFLDDLNARDIMAAAIRARRASRLFPDDPIPLGIIAAMRHDEGGGGGGDDCCTALSWLRRASLPPPPPPSYTIPLLGDPTEFDPETPTAAVPPGRGGQYGLPFPISYKLCSSPCACARAAHAPFAARVRPFLLQTHRRRRQQLEQLRLSFRRHRRRPFFLFISYCGVFLRPSVPPLSYCAEAAA